MQRWSGYCGLATFLLAGLSLIRLDGADAAEPPVTIRRRIPPPGIELPAAQRDKWQTRLDELTGQLDAVSKRAHAADAAVLLKAVRWALKHGEFYNPKEFARADAVLDAAADRIGQLAGGATPWHRARGRVVRGYRSSIDGSLQPYGLEIPDDVDFDRPVPLYVWLHGRGDKTTDLHFIHQRMTRGGRIAPPGAIVLHPFGRHCMGFKSAGEIDVLEAVADVQSRYRIDPRRIALMGFSMGGAGAWHVGAHYTDRWVAISPGAGFAETARYNRLTKDKYPAWYVQQLWGLYDVPGYVRNLFNVPVVAYSGELDKQIQAARVMEQAFASHKRKLPHLIGPKMGHRYDPKTLAELMERMEGFVRTGLDPRPRHVDLQTRTLRYNKQFWVELSGIKRHWRDSQVRATVTDTGKLQVVTKNATRLRLSPPMKLAGATIEIDSQTLTVPATGKSPSHVTLAGPAPWRIIADDKPASGKRPGLQGPIDDAFMEPFLVVTPTGKARHESVQRWVDFELARLRDRWSALYRGDLPEKPDREITTADIQSRHLIVFGDPQMNSVLAAALKPSPVARPVGPPLPLQWSATDIRFGGRTFSAADHLPILIYPNPRNPEKYLVVNSGPTFREGHDRTNSLQNPKLGDWSIISLDQPPSDTLPGRVAIAGFFDEAWKFDPRLAEVPGS